MSTLGPSLPEIPIGLDGVILTEVIGTTISPKSSVRRAVEELGIVELVGRAFCAAEEREKQDHAIKIERARATNGTNRIIFSFRL